MTTKMMTLKDVTAEKMAEPLRWSSPRGSDPEERARALVDQHNKGYKLDTELNEDYELYILASTAIREAVEDAIAGERARVCKILRETPVNATRAALERGIAEGATHIWVGEE